MDRGKGEEVALLLDSKREKGGVYGAWVGPMPLAGSTTIS